VKNLRNITALLVVVCCALVMASCEVDCPICEGSGICVTCEGTGNLRKTLNQDLETIPAVPADPCTDCGGTGDCQTCDGTGKYSSI
jgi:hypothetical protein